MRVRHLHQDFTFRGKRQEKVKKSCGHFLMCPRRQTSSVQLRLTIHGCGSLRDITKHCSLHPGSLPSQALPLQGYSSPPGGWTSALLQLRVSAGSLASATSSGCWVCGQPQPLRAPFLTPMAPQLRYTVLAVPREGSSSTHSDAVRGPASPVSVL